MGTGRPRHTRPPRAAAHRGHRLWSGAPQGAGDSRCLFLPNTPRKAASLHEAGEASTQRGNGGKKRGPMKKPLQK